MRGASQFDPGKVLGDRGLGLTVSLRQGEPPSQHVAIIGLNRDSMNTKDVVTSTLDSINVMTAGALKKKDGATIEFEPLMQSSTDSELLPVMRARVPAGQPVAARGLQADAASVTPSPRASTAS